ncbi:hypothetical protein [Streptomyces sp. NEAU-174]|uniref:hypothetical protein n=1 Tax=Streptomyces sp. NEAU-174 TaxID=3458254 RepID=UPI004043C570
MDMISLISMLAAVAATLISTAVWQTTQRLEKRNLFLQLNERLMQPRLQEGRTLLRELIIDKTAADNLYSSNDRRDHWLISESIAMFDLLGLYVERKYVDEKLVLEEWGSQIALTYKRHGKPFLESRAAYLGWTPYPHYEKLGELALLDERRRGRNAETGE